MDLVKAERDQNAGDAGGKQVDDERQTHDHAQPPVLEPNAGHYPHDHRKHPAIGHADHHFAENQPADLVAIEFFGRE